MEELGHVDAALLCTPTRSVEETALPLLARGINTVDSFDIHGDIVALRRSLGAQAIKHDAVSIISAGWDPGTDSVIRTLMLAMAPKGITYTNFGPGMSMGHSLRPVRWPPTVLAPIWTASCGSCRTCRSTRRTSAVPTRPVIRVNSQSGKGGMAYLLKPTQP